MPNTLARDVLNRRASIHPRRSSNSKTINAASLASASIATPSLATAQAPTAAAPASPYPFTVNAKLFSSDRFRSIDETFGKPALHGGSDSNYTSGFYFGNWNANINQGAGYPGGNLELDFYGRWKFLSLKYYHSVDDYFSTPGTKGKT